MFEKVNPSHPDKIADRIAGAMVDMAYDMTCKKQEDPRIAVEVLIGHGNCYIIYESSMQLDETGIKEAVYRITGSRSWYFEIDYSAQDQHLAENQSDGFRCGDNGIFKGCPITEEQRRLTDTMRAIYETFPYDGKAVLDNDRIILCQSNAAWDELVEHPALEGYHDYLINPLGSWTGGTDVDTGATNRKLGSDMGMAVTGGGLHGKDCSKADVSMNIACNQIARATGREVTASCAIGDDVVTFVVDSGHIGEERYSAPYKKVVEDAKAYIAHMGGFEKFAEWGMI